MSDDKKPTPTAVVMTDGGVKFDASAAYDDIRTVVQRLLLDTRPGMGIAVFAALCTLLGETVGGAPQEVQDDLMGQILSQVMRAKMGFAVQASVSLQERKPTIQ